MSTVENTLGMLNNLPYPDDGKRSSLFVLGFFATTVVLLILLGGSFGRYLIPMAATVTAYLLYRRAPATYVSFVWWLWFLSCFLRRIVDYRNGFAESNPIVAAPFLASLVCMPALLQRTETWKLRGSFPFVLAFASALYGLGVGFLCIPKKILLMSALGWFSPLVFGFFHIFRILKCRPPRSLDQFAANNISLGRSPYGSIRSYSVLPGSCLGCPLDDREQDGFDRESRAIWHKSLQHHERTGRTRLHAGRRPHFAVEPTRICASACRSSRMCRTSTILCSIGMGSFAPRHSLTCNS